MSEPSPSSPSGGRTAAENLPGTWGKVFAVLCWLVLLAAALGIAVTLYVRTEHRAESERQLAISAEQRRIAAAAAELARGLAGDALPDASAVSALRTDALALHAQVSPGPPPELDAQWRRLAGGLDTVRSEWGRIVGFRDALAALRADGHALRETAAGLADLGAGGGAAGPLARASTEVLALASAQLADALERASLAEPAILARAEALLDAGRRAHRLAAGALVRPPALPAPPAGRAPVLRAELAAAAVAAAAARLDATSERLSAVRATASTLDAASAALREIEAGSASVLSLLPRFLARIASVPEFRGVPLDSWLHGLALVALAALLGLFLRHGRVLRLEASGLDRAWAEAAESDWRARGLVRNLLRAIDSLDRRGAPGASRDETDLEGKVREATASLAHVVARRSQLAATLLSARETLRDRLAAARDSVLGGVGRAPGDFDPTPLLEIEATFQEATLYAMAALVREIRTAAGEAPDTAGTAPSPDHPAQGPASTRDLTVHGFELLERSLERVLSGEREEYAALVFLMDDLRIARGRPSFSSSLDFDPGLESVAAAGAAESAVLRTDAARMLPSFRKGLEAWGAAAGDASSAARLMRGSVAVLARAGGGEAPLERGFWNVAAAFCTALCEGGVPDGPAVRRTLSEVAREFAETAESEATRPAPPELLRQLLICIALAECDHADLEAVRSAFHLDRYPLVIPVHRGEPVAVGERPDADVPEDLIRQLEGIRAALDRINRPADDLAARPPSS